MRVQTRICELIEASGGGFTSKVSWAVVAHEKAAHKTDMDRILSRLSSRQSTKLRHDTCTNITKPIYRQVTSIEMNQHLSTQGVMQFPRSIESKIKSLQSLAQGERYDIPFLRVRTEASDSGN